MSIYKQAERAIRKKKKTISKHSEETERWREFWREVGPIRFAQEVLECPQDTPPYPNWKELQKTIYCEGCKKEHKVFRPTGIPYHIILSPDQKELLEDLWIGQVNRAILTAGRGAGKTFTLSIWICWRITCSDFYDITNMGGSQTQSKIAQGFVDYWRIRSRIVGYCIKKSVGGVATAPYCQSRWFSTCFFPPCSEASARGPHIRDLFVDEACVAESKSVEGRKAVRSARFQITGTSESHFLMSSTAHFIFGSFYDTWRNADRLGFRRYRWSIAKHISEADEISSKDRNWDLLDNVLVKDRNPKHWKPAVWWITQDDIEMLREGSSNAEWLVEALGGISRGSGLVFSPKDLKSCICNRCGDDKECKPYQENYCKLIEEFKLGDKLQHITERKCGVDFGGRVPNSQVIVGRHGKMIFVLFADEVLGLSQDEVVDWIDKPCKKLKVWEIYADPEERGMVWILESKGYAMPELWAFGGGGMKKVFVSNAKRWIERHNAIIPKAFVKLIESLQQMAWNEKGKIIKHNDHAISGDSEILTKEGWKNYITLTYSDKIATRNPETGELEYQYPTDIMIRNWDGDMYKFKNHSISFMVSPNHNMAFTHQCDYIKKRNKIDVSKIPNLPQNIFIPKTATWKGKNKQFIEIPSQSNHPRHKKIGKLSMDAFLAFLGLWLAEGCVSKSHYQVIIDQNKLREQKVKDIFNNLGLKYHSWNMGKNVVRYAIQSIDLYIFFKKFGKSHDKFIPNWVFNLSKRQLQILFDSMMFGDGSKQKCYWHYDTVSQKLADDFQKLLLHLGFCGNIYNLKYNGSKSFRISIWKSKNAQIHKREIKKTHYKGKIYCVDVPNHIIYVRQNGKPMWTGNSFDGFIYAISDFDISGGIEQLYEVKKREINRIW